MIIFSISLDMKSDSIVFSDTDPSPLQQKFWDPGGSESGSGSTTLLIIYVN